MRILLIRHAIAAPLGKGAKRDDVRRLTPTGESRFRRVAKALRDITPRPRAILTSPLLRARETAEIAAKTWGSVNPVIVPALVDGDWDGICRALERYDASDTVVLVGHESWISDLTARLLDAKSGRAFSFRKGGVALIETSQVRFGRGKLLWFIPPRVFRKL